MKKYLILFSVFLIFYIVFLESSEEKVIVPEDSLRIRIIPNSNSSSDQLKKALVKEEILKIMPNLLEGAQNVNDAKTIIKNNLDEIDNKIKNVLVDEDYNLNFGYNYFPSKVYKGVTYESGYYDSLVIEIGNKKGENWWCVLYPPLCLVDEDNKEYKSFIKEIINKYF